MPADMDTTKLLIDLLGWTGAAMLLLAYALVSSRRLRGDGFAFQAMNLAGSALLAGNSAYYGAWPSVALNGAWMVVGLTALRRRQRAT